MWAAKGQMSLHILSVSPVFNAHTQKEGTLMIRPKFKPLAPPDSCTLMFNTLPLLGSTVVECLTQDRGAAGSSLTNVTVLCPWARHIFPCFVLVQPRKAHPGITENCWLGCKESNPLWGPFRVFANRADPDQGLLCLLMEIWYIWCYTGGPDK